MYPPLTYKLLESKKACADQLVLVKEHFGLEPIPLTDEVIEKFGSIFDIEWAAKSLLTRVDFLEYNKVTAPAYSEYNKVTERVWAEYNRVTELAWAEYHRITAKEFVRLYSKGM